MISKITGTSSQCTLCQHALSFLIGLEHLVESKDKARFAQIQIESTQKVHAHFALTQRASLTKPLPSATAAKDIAQSFMAPPLRSAQLRSETQAAKLNNLCRLSLTKPFSSKELELAAGKSK